MNENELMGSMKVSKAVAKMAIPSVISSLVTVVYNMADTFFVGQTGDPLQVAAVSLMAFANMFGMGGSAVASMAMGEKNEKRVKNTSAFVTYASLIVGILFALILIFFVKPILYTFGANSQTYEVAKGYTFHVSYDRKYDRYSCQHCSGSGIYQRTWNGGGRGCDCDNDRQYSGKHLLSLVFHEKE